MDQQNFSSPSSSSSFQQPSPKGVKSVWVVIMLVSVIALIGVLVWQKTIPISPNGTFICVEDVNDGGANFYLFGSFTRSVAGKNSSGATYYKDYCIDGKNLREFWCTTYGKVGEQTYACPNGCENGACKSAATTSEETAGWKSYTSSAIGFSMKYPDNLVPTKEIDESGGKRVSFVEDSAWRLNNPIPYSSELAILRGESYYENARKLSCSDWLLNYKERKEVFLGGTSALFGSNFDAGHSDKPPTKIYLICQDSTNTQIYFTVYSFLDSQEDNYLSFLNNIISTFQFTH